MLAADDPYADLRVLVHWHGQPIRRVLSRRQVTIGPFLEDVSDGNRIVSLKTPLGLYDVKEFVGRLPVDQRPDVFVVLIDATKAAVPQNLAALDCPSVLVVGDTHHLDAPLRFMLSALLTEPYALVVGNHVAQHLHFLAPASRAPVVWIPGLWVEHHDLQFQERRTGEAVFVGQVGQFHPYRSAALEAVRAAGLKLAIRQAPQRAAAELHGAATVTLNISLNGDLNMRVFEALGHGGCLLTDRLAPESGLFSLFRDGEDLVTYDGIDELVAKARQLIAHPDEALAIARRGFEKYRRDHHPDLKRRQLFSMLLNDGKYPSPQWSDRRVEKFPAANGGDLNRRLLVYEQVQERHRHAIRLRALATPEVATAILADLSDLPRLTIGNTGPADLLLATPEDAAASGFAATVASAKPQEIVLTGPTTLAPPPGYAAVPGELTVWKSA